MYELHSETRLASLSAAEEYGRDGEDGINLPLFESLHVEDVLMESDLSTLQRFATRRRATRSGRGRRFRSCSKRYQRVTSYSSST